MCAHSGKTRDFLLKNIIIAGPSRAGKSTFAKKINEELGCFVISLDKLAAVFDGAYPQLNIGLNRNRHETSDNLAPFLGHFLGAFSSGNGTVYELNLRAHDIKGNKFVLEGGYFNFNMILPVLKMYGINNLKDSFHLIGLVQNRKTADEFISDFRKHDTEDDWTYGFSENELREISEELISFSLSMTEHLNKYGFTVYDTSRDREQVLSQIIRDITVDSI